MDFKDQIKQLGDRVAKMLPQIKTEEATKNALIMPFIQLLGYDVFNPFEVNPEFVADLGIKKGEKVDYAIMNDGEPTILIECKHHAESLDPHNSQLFRYFHTTKAKFGILTNGLCYRFYTDLVAANKMDETPFMEFNLNEIKENEIVELKKFHKSHFNVETIVSTASELKYTTSVKNIFASELKSPTQWFVKFFLGQVYDGKATERIVLQFTEIVKKALNQYISDQISDRLKFALEKETAPEPVSSIVVEADVEKAIETTDLEKEAFFIVKSILRQKVEGSRIVGRDTQTYFGVLLDDNNRKPLCRLWLNGGKKYLGVFDENKKEMRLEITVLDDIYKYGEQLLKGVEYYV
jgi:predicted type IV restriction endonuclease